MQSSINTTDVQPQMTSTPMVPRSNTSMPVVPSVPSAETSGLQRTPVERQMTAILESLAYHSKMISTLQEQLTTLTTKVVKLQQQAPGTKVTSKENPPARSRTFSISSIESETSNLQRVNSDQQQSTDIGQTPSLPRSKSKDKNRKDNVNLRNTKTNASQQSQQVPEAKKTLIIGDSIIKGINPRGLKDNIHCIGIPRANVETVHDTKLVEMENFFCDSVGNPVLRYYGKDKTCLCLE